MSAALASMEFLDWIPDDQKWRHVRFRLSRLDASREWRLPDNLDLTKISGFYALVWNYTDIEDLRKVGTKAPTLGNLPMEHLTKMM
jgi:hypothetical protein